MAAMSRPRAKPDQKALVKEIGKLLLRTVPKELPKMRADYRAAGKHVEVDLVGVDKDGVSESFPVPQELPELFDKLREVTYRDDRGTWLAATYHLERPGTFSVDFDGENEPKWRRKPPPIGFQDELKRFPREDPFVPDWLKQRMAAVPAAQVRGGSGPQPGLPIPAGPPAGTGPQPGLVTGTGSHPVLPVGRNSHPGFPAIAPTGPPLRPPPPPLPATGQHPVPPIQQTGAHPVPPVQQTGSHPVPPVQQTGAHPIPLPPVAQQQVPPRPAVPPPHAAPPPRQTQSAPAPIVTPYGAPREVPGPRGTGFTVTQSGSFPVPPVRPPSGPPPPPTTPPPPLPPAAPQPPPPGTFPQAQPFDGNGKDGPYHQRPPLSPGERDQILAYLTSAPIVLAARGFDPDPLNPDGRSDVPVTYHTDGVWVWPGVVPYVLRKHDVPPESALLAHIRGNRYQVPELANRIRELVVDSILADPR
jgi:hypothetical protein